MSTIQSTYEVDSEAYTQSVYPVDIDAPTKVISETVETIVEVANSTITVTTTHGIPQKEPYDSHTVNDVKSKDPHTATAKVDSITKQLGGMGMGAPEKSGEPLEQDFEIDSQMADTVKEGSTYEGRDEIDQMNEPWMIGDKSEFLSYYEIEDKNAEPYLPREEHIAGGELTKYNVQVVTPEGPKAAHFHQGPTCECGMFGVGACGFE